MADMNEIVRLAVDAYHGTTTKYSKSESMDTLRQAMVAANNGSTTLNYKNIRDGKLLMRLMVLRAFAVSGWAE